MKKCEDWTTTGAPAKRAAELEIGDTMIWNYGGTSTLVSIDRETAKTIWTTVESSGKLYNRKFRKTTLVATEDCQD